MFQPSRTSTSRGGQGMVNKDSGKRPCVVCTGEFDKKDLIDLVCKHRWCGSCINDAFLGATKDRSRYPPRCCNEIQPHQVRSQLNKDLLQKYLSKKREWDCDNPTYCSDEKCSTFIDDRNIKGMEATCPKCGKKACIKCKTTGHGAASCSEEEESRTCAMAVKYGWKRCPDCRRLIERFSGCNKMLCVCKCKFCWDCLRIIWHNCPQKINQAAIHTPGFPMLEVPVAAVRLPKQTGECQIPRYRGCITQITDRNRTPMLTQNQETPANRIPNQPKKTSLPRDHLGIASPRRTCLHPEFLAQPFLGVCKQCQRRAVSDFRKCTGCSYALCQTCFHLNQRGRRGLGR